MDATNSPKPSLRGRLAALLLLSLTLGAMAAIAYWAWHGLGFSAEPGTAETAHSEGEEPKPEGNPAAQFIQLSDESVRKYGIRTGIAHKQKLVSEIVAPARIAFNSEAMAVIGTPVQGRAVEIRAVVGDRVERGAELLEIESVELGEVQSDYLQRQSAGVMTRAAIRPLTEIYTRVKKLYDENKLVGITEVQERELELRKAEGALAAAEAAVTAARNKLHLLGMQDDAIERLESTSKVNPRYVVRAPLAGEVIERTVNLGELVKPDREKLFVVADTSTLWVWADVPEQRAAEVVKGATARIAVADNLDRSQTGVISHVAANIDPETHSMRVRIDMKSDPAIKPGMFAQVHFNGKPLGQSDQAMLVVPQSAIQNLNGESAVFVPVAGVPNAYSVRTVVIGVCSDGMACVTSGLSENERIVTSGGAILKADLLKASAKDED